MARFALQYDILDPSIAVAVNRRGILIIKVHDDASLHISRLARIGTDIINVLPPLHILADRLAVEKDDGNIGGARFVDDDGSCGSVDLIDTDRVIPLRQKTVHLLVLSPLVSGAIQNIECDFYVVLCLPRFGTVEQIGSKQRNKRVALPVERYADADGIGRHGLGWLVRAAAGKQQAAERAGKQCGGPETSFHKRTSLHLRSVSG